MYLVVGLGNPGTQYEMTRHNIGFHTIDYIADKLNVKVKKLKYKVENIIVISDDISLDTGRIRVRPKGSAGGHNGLKSIIYQLNSDEFPRVKMGVGAPKHEDYDLADFVLGRFTKDEIPVMEEAIIKASKAVNEIIKNGAQSAMNKYNSR